MTTLPTLLVSTYIEDNKPIVALFDVDEESGSASVVDYYRGPENTHINDLLDIVIDNYKEVAILRAKCEPHELLNAIPLGNHFYLEMNNLKDACSIASIYYTTSTPTKQLTVGELKKLIADVPDHVLVYVENISGIGDIYSTPVYDVDCFRTENDTVGFILK
jgi:hypothetical protein